MIQSCRHALVESPISETGAHGVVAVVDYTFAAGTELDGFGERVLRVGAGSRQDIEIRDGFAEGSGSDSNRLLQYDGP